MNEFDYKPYAQKYQDLWNWSLRVKPFMTKGSRENFVLRIMKKNHNDLWCKAWDYVKEAKAQRKAELRAYKESVYQGHEIKRLAGAQAGECFLFVTSNGDVRYLKCTGKETRYGYDYGEWCVADRGYSYEVAVFVDDEGKKRAYSGDAAVISEDEFIKAELKRQ